MAVRRTYRGWDGCQGRPTTLFRFSCRQSLPGVEGDSPIFADTKIGTVPGQQRSDTSAVIAIWLLQPSPYPYPSPSEPVARGQVVAYTVEILPVAIRTAGAIVGPPREHIMSERKPLTRGQWFALAAAFLGWMFDGVELGLMPLVSRPALKNILQVNDDSVVARYHGPLIACFLLGAACGGFAFGWLGDKIGRVRAMTLSILTYSIFTGCGYFATQPWHLWAVLLPCRAGNGRPMVAGRGAGHGVLAGEGPPAARRRDRRSIERRIPGALPSWDFVFPSLPTIGDG